MGISQQCQSDNHQSCPTQVQINNEQTNCQCSCHSGSDVTKSRSEVLSNEQARARTLTSSSDLYSIHAVREITKDKLCSCS